MAHTVMTPLGPLVIPGGDPPRRPKTVLWDGVNSVLEVDSETFAALVNTCFTHSSIQLRGAALPPEAVEATENALIDALTEVLGGPIPMGQWTVKVIEPEPTRWVTRVQHEAIEHKTLEQVCDEVEGIASPKPRCGSCGGRWYPNGAKDWCLVCRPAKVS